MTLNFHDITFRYGRSRTPIFRNFTWNVTGRRTVLLGPNGAGKSTLLKIAAGLHLPRSGECTLAGLSWQARADRAAYARSIGWMPQHIGALSGLTALEQVSYAGWLRGLGSKDAQRKASDALDRVGLTEQRKVRVSALSGGQLRRVGLAEALVAEPKYLLLDEPTAGLDPSQRARFHTILRGLEGVHVIVSTHEIDDLDSTYEAVAVLVRGEVVFDGSVPDFYAHGVTDDAPLSDTQRATQAYEHFALDPNA